jgi:beta-glucosidase
MVSFFDDVYNQIFFDLLKNGRISLNPLIREKWLKDTSDYFGINYYEAVFFKFKFGIPYSMDLKLPGEKRVTQMVWGVFPRCLYENIMRVKQEYKGPIYVTENGLATLDDSERQFFILEHLIEVNRAIKNGADVKGYFYWSSMDNWEWAEGFEPRFGLLGINYDTQEREIRESAEMFSEIAKLNKIPSYLLEKFKLDA